jgi:hypothetical protein
MGLTGLRFAGWAAVCLVGCIIVIGLIKPWGIGIDFANFYDAGQKAGAGEFQSLYDPFALIAGQKPLGNMLFFSAPITSILYAPLAALPPNTALFVFKALGTVAMVWGLVLLYFQSRPPRGADDRNDAAFFALFAGAVLLFQPFWTIYRVGGQTMPFIFLLLVLGHIFYLRGAFVMTAVIFGVIVLIKPIFAATAILLFLASPNSFRLAALVSAALVGGVSVYLFGWDLHMELLRVISEKSMELTRPWNNSSPFSWFEVLLVTPQAYAASTQVPDAVHLGQTVLRLATIVALILALIRQLSLVTDPRSRRHLVFVTGLLLVILVSPVLWAYYLAVMFIPLAYIIARRALLPRGAIAVFSVATVLCLFQNLILIQRLYGAFGFDTTPEILVIGLVKSLPALLFLGGILVYHRPLAESLRGVQLDRSDRD